MTKGRIAAYSAGGLVGAFLLLFFLGLAFAPDDSPGARLTRIRDQCDQTYGANTSQSFDCFTALMTRYAREQRRDTLDQTYQNAR